MSPRQSAADAVLICDDCRLPYPAPRYLGVDPADCDRTGPRHPECTGSICPTCAGPDPVPDQPGDPRRPALLDDEPTVGRIPPGDLEITGRYGRVEAIPEREGGRVIGYEIYHPNGVRIGTVHLDDDEMNCEGRDGETEEIEAETPLEALRLAVSRLVAAEGPAPYLGALGYPCAAGHRDCAHLGAGPCHRETEHVLACEAGDCAGALDPETA